ncbi:MAG: DNA methyltransferase [Candidatus Thorarchaeota archaeon]
MKSYIVLPFVQRRPIPEKFHDDDNRSIESLVEYFLHYFSKPGDTVFDPFAGLGTTLLAAEDIGRIPFGIEADEERVEYVRSMIKNKDNILLGDSRRLDEFQIPEVDFVYTSPIFMGCDETMNPLSGFKEPGTYVVYLDDIQSIFSKMRKFLKPSAKIVVDVYNLQATDTRPMTLLAWDMARSISKVLKFEKEIVVCWQEGEIVRSDSPQKNGYDHSYCLVFSSE